MSIPAGSHVGPYLVIGPLGEGGMGEVYRARDTRLGREVALKVLPSSMSADGERLLRFEQEARAAAALNHPNILVLYDIGTHENKPYLVGELLEGETLRELLGRGALQPRKAMEYDAQVARGLAAAHEKGIVHRDLKPENVFVTPDGRVKILDFGLAKLKSHEVPLSSASVVPTLPTPTSPGVVLGTVGYMSPEQVRGLPADHRSDIFAFGGLLYEMLTGGRAFHRDTPAETMTAILKEEPPDLATSEASADPPLQRIVRRCLEKNPAARFQSAGDLAFALETLSFGPRTSAAAAAMPAQRSRSRVPWLVAAGCLIVDAAGALLYLTVVRPVAREARLIRFSVSPPEGWRTELTGSTDIPVAVSPDGRHLVGRAINDEGSRVLWVRPLAALDTRILAGTEDASTFFWSPDSRFLGFFSDGTLKKIDISGGPPAILANVPFALGGTWSANGQILFGGRDGLQKVPAAGGTLSQALPLASDEAFHSLPIFLPDGEHFVFVAAIGAEVRGGSRRRLYAASLGSNDRTLLFDTDQFATVAGVARGHLLFLRGNTLMAQLIRHGASIADR